MCQDKTNNNNNNKISRTKCLLRLSNNKVNIFHNKSVKNKNSMKMVKSQKSLGKYHKNHGHKMSEIGFLDNQMKLWISIEVSTCSQSKFNLLSSNQFMKKLRCSGITNLMALLIPNLIIRCNNALVTKITTSYRSSTLTQDRIFSLWNSKTFNKFVKQKWNSKMNKWKTSMELPNIKEPFIK